MARNQATPRILNSTHILAALVQEVLRTPRTLQDPQNNLPLVRYGSVLYQIIYSYSSTISTSEFLVYVLLLLYFVVKQGAVTGLPPAAAKHAELCAAQTPRSSATSAIFLTKKIRYQPTMSCDYSLPLAQPWSYNHSTSATLLGLQYLTLPGYLRPADNPSGYATCARKSNKLSSCISSTHLSCEIYY